MSTYRDLISDIRGTHKLLSTDASITDRVIASELRNSALLLIKRETNLRKLWATDTIFTTIPCLEMEEVPVTDCCAIQSDETIARSKNKIPKIAEGSYQYVIQGVYSINALGGGGTRLKEITINRYTNLLKLQQRKSDVYFWINNDYLYCTNPDASLLRISALFEDPLDNTILFPSCGCGDSPNKDEYCKNPLDRDFFLPGYLRKQTLQLASQTLRESYFNIKEDVSPEGLDEQAVNINQNRRR